MPSHIHILDDATINKIAAGEVVENAASVVKELVENSLDAAAQEITIEIKGGGRQLIRVTDDGCGMNADDALLCLERHATSKIRSIDDIFSTPTMGFRGEAIPSIAAVSKFTLITAPQEKREAATLLMVEGGKIIKCSPAVRTPGTTVEVKALFFNVPARRKFQKSPSQDEAEILKLVSKLALSHPTIKFHLIIDQQTMLITSRNNNSSSFVELLTLRVKEVLGNDFHKETYPVELKEQGVTFQGLLGKPTSHRPHRTGQYLFINRRAVYSSFISQVIADAYGTALPTHRYPLFVLHLALPGELVDVNVHPQKREVRLREQTLIKELITIAVGKALQGTDTPFTFSPTIPTLSLESSFTPFSYTSLLQATPTASPPLIGEVIQESQPAFLPTLSPEELQPSSRLQVIATLPRYILASQGEQVIVIDGRAAHARVLFERLKGNPIKTASETQILLIPHTLEVTTPDKAILREYLPALEKIGFGIREFGRNSFVIDALPTAFNGNEIENIIHSLLGELHQGGREKESLLAMAAARAAMSTTKKLGLIEAQLLLDALVQCQCPFTCPRGTALMLPLNSENLASLFH